MSSLLLRRFGRLRVAAVILVSLPFLVLPVLGLAWLWNEGLLLEWMLSMVALGTIAWLLHAFAQWRENHFNRQPETEPNPAWPPSADGAWQRVSSLANGIDPAEWSITEGDKLWELGRRTLESVAGYYHPGREQPLLELTLPHALMIIERASRELREEISRHVPLSHQIKLGDIARAKRLKDWFTRLETFYRVGRVAVDPASVLFAEIRREFANRIFDYGSDRVQRWLIREFVRKVGFYAIELYSGQVLLEAADPVGTPTNASKRDSKRALQIEQVAREPVRIVVLGRMNAGKSSLINALLGDARAPVDALPGTTLSAEPFRLEREGEDAALIFDTPGIDEATWKGTDELKQLLLSADLLLWSTSAAVADRGPEREVIDEVRALWRERNDRPVPPWLLVVTHIDTLKPSREWNPPYDLVHPRGKKAEAIRDATLEAAEALGFPLANAVPVCLAPDRLYNVEDALWAAIFVLEKETDRARFLRCLDERKRAENWSLVGKQLLGAGRWLLEAPFKKSP
jgi:small GTP-binding protein